VVTITEGCNKIVLNGETDTITGKASGGGCVNQTWWGDVHVNDNLKGTSTEESTPVASLNNMTVAGFCQAANKCLQDTVVSGQGWYVVYDNATGHIVSESI